MPKRSDRTGAFWRGVALPAALLCAACQFDPPGPPPPTVTYAGLPVSGSLSDAQRARFARCIRMDSVHMRCRRSGVILMGEGPYEAALDLDGSDGNGGFRQITLWHDTDQNAVLKVSEVLKKQGWAYRYTGQGGRGDQMIFTRPGEPVQVSMDLSYWGKRRIRLLPK